MDERKFRKLKHIGGPSLNELHFITEGFKGHDYVKDVYDIKCCMVYWDRVENDECTTIQLTVQIYEKYDDKRLILEVVVDENLHWFEGSEGYDINYTLIKSRVRRLIDAAKSIIYQNLISSRTYLYAWPDLDEINVKEIEPMNITKEVREKVKEELEK